MNSGREAGSEAKGNAGRWFLCLIGALVLLMGVLFFWLLFRSYQNAMETRDWTEVEAQILQSGIEQRQYSGSPVEYRLLVVFGYGEGYTSDRLTPRGAKWSREKVVVEKKVAQYPMGSTHTAWMDPDDPKRAILEHDTKAAGYTLWFPALFVVAGGGIIWGALR